MDPFPLVFASHAGRRLGLEPLDGGVNESLIDPVAEFERHRARR